MENNRKVCCQFDTRSAQRLLVGLVGVQQSVPRFSSIDRDKEILGKTSYFPDIPGSTVARARRRVKMASIVQSDHVVWPGSSETVNKEPIADFGMK